MKQNGMMRRMLAIPTLTTLLCLAFVPAGLGQNLDSVAAAEKLPAAPQPQGGTRAKAESTAATSLATSYPGDAAQMAGSSSSQAAPVPPPTGPLHLTRVQAEQLAIKNNPRISVGRLMALAQHQVYRESRSGLLPTFNGDITAADANEGSRIGAGALTASRLFEHAGGGVTLNQLLTDFGHTVNLASSSKLQEKAANANALATEEDIILATDQAFYDALQAQALLKVAQQTVTTRQSVETQVNELTKSKLKSEVDLAFAQVNLSEAKLLLLDAQNNVDSTVAVLTAVLGFDKQVQYELVEENKGAPTPPPPDVDVVTNTALQQRPDLQSLAFNQQAAEKFRRAQRDQLFPTISALAIAGGIPVRPDCIGGCNRNYFISSWYGSVGVNMSIPIFNGFLFTAEASEAKFRAKAAAENTRNLRDDVVRDVRTAWLAANTSFQRVGVAEELSKEADLALQLAQGRYQLGLSSIVELSQAQLQQASAAIGYVNAQYQYKLTLSTLNFEMGVVP
jgi:outer membrane protein